MRPAKSSSSFENRMSPLHWDTPIEKLTIAIVLSAVFCIFAFYSLADAVHEGETERFDIMLMSALHHPGNPADPIGPPWFEELVRDVSALGSNGIALLILAIGAGYLTLTGHRATAGVLFVSIVGGIIMASLLKLGFDRPRPDIFPQHTRVFTSSFPSSHAAVSATVYLTLGALIARSQRLYKVKLFVLTASIIVVFLIGLSRVYLGVHWPSDVLAGWTIGAAWAFIALLLVSSLDSRRLRARLTHGQTKAV